MTAVALFARGAGATVRRDWAVFVSYRLRLVMTLFSQVFSLVLFYYISRLVNVETFQSPDAYYAFAVVGLIILQVLNSTLGTPSNQLRGELMAGTFERVVTSPFGPAGVLVSSLLFPFLYSLATAMVMLMVAGVLFGLDLRWETLALAVPLSVLGSLAFLPFGVGLLALTLLVKQAAMGTTFIVAGISLIAGLYFPVSYLPDWIEWTSQIQPFTPAVELLRNVIIGHPMQDPAWLNLAKLAGFTALLLPFALLALNAAVAKARRAGTIIEY